MTETNQLKRKALSDDVEQAKVASASAFELDGKISSDGIHPTAEGFDILGQMVWDLMQAEHVRR